MTGQVRLLPPALTIYKLEIMSYEVRRSDNQATIFNVEMDQIETKIGNGETGWGISIDFYKEKKDFKSFITDSGEIHNQKSIEKQLKRLKDYCDHFIEDRIPVKKEDNICRFERMDQELRSVLGQYLQYKELYLEVD
jgi:hypothetical protein